MGRGDGSRPMAARGLLYGPRPLGRRPKIIDMNSIEVEDWEDFRQAVPKLLALSNIIYQAEARQVVAQLIDDPVNPNKTSFEYNQPDGIRVFITPMNDGDRLGIGFRYFSDEKRTLPDADYQLGQDPKGAISPRQLRELLVANRQQLKLDFLNYQIPIDDLNWVIEQEGRQLRLLLPQNLRSGGLEEHRVEALRILDNYLNHLNVTGSNEVAQEARDRLAEEINEATTPEEVLALMSRDWFGCKAMENNDFILFQETFNQKN